MAAASQLSKESPTAEASSVRYRVNLLILIAFLLLLTFWFYRHLHLYVTESILIGGTVTLWGAWKVVQTTFKTWLGKESSTWTQQFLGRSGATEYLIFGLVLLTILWAGTSSIYLVYDGSGSGQSEFRVDVLVDGNPIVDTLSVTSVRRTAGRPFFFRSRQTIELVIRSPAGFESEERPFRPWSNIYLRVPGEFTEKSFRLLRFVPRLGMLGDLPQPSSPTQSAYFLTVEIDGIEQKVGDLRFQTLYLGAGLGDLERLIAAEPSEVLMRELEGFASIFPVEARATFLAAWQAKPRLIETVELEEGDRVVVSVRREGGEALLEKYEIIVAGETIHSVALEVSPDLVDETEDEPDA